MKNRSFFPYSDADERTVSYSGVVSKGVVLIRDIVQKTLTTGYLTIEAEEQLRQMLKTKYDLEDFNAFMTLQSAAMIGQVKQESRERLRYTNQ